MARPRKDPAEAARLARLAADAKFRRPEAIRTSFLLASSEEASAWQLDRRIDGGISTKFRVSRCVDGRWSHVDYESAEAAIAAVEQVGVAA